MAVELPKLQRFNSPPTPSVGRVQVQGPNLGAGVSGMQQAAGGIAKDVSTFVIQQEDAAIETMALQKANEYNNYVNDAIDGPQGLKYYEGDPTEKYQQFQNDIEKKGQELLGDENLSDRAKRVLAAKLDSVRAKTYDRANTVYGTVYNQYKTRIDNDSVRLNQTDLVNATEFINPKDPDSFIQFDAAIGRIQDIRLKSGVGNGSVEVDENGNYLANPSVKLQLAKDLSDGVYAAIDNLNAAGRVEEAALMQEKYARYLDPVNRKKLTDRNKDETIKKEGLLLAESVRFMNEDDAFNKIDSAKVSPEVRKQARENLNSYQRQKEAALGRAKKETYNNLMSYVLSRQNGEGGLRPFLTTNELYNDPTFKKYPFQDLDAKQQSAILAAVAPPKTSDPEAEGAIYESLRNGELRGMSRQDFNMMTSRLSKSDKAKFDRLWTDANTESDTEKSQRMRYMGQQLKNQLIDKKAIRSVFGKLTDENQRKYNKAWDEMIQAADAMPPGTSQAEQTKWVQEWTQSYLKGEAFTAPDQVQPFRSAPSKPRQEPATNPQTAPAKDTSKKLTPEEIRAWVIKFRQVNKRDFNPKNGDNMQDFIKSQGGRL